MSCRIGFKANHDDDDDVSMNVFKLLRQKTRSSFTSGNGRRGQLLFFVELRLTQ